MSEIFTLTPRAVEHVMRAMTEEGLEGHGLRIGVVSGGCSGYEYSISFVAEGEADDHVVDVGDFRVFIDRESSEKLAGTVLDYVHGLYGAGLKFTNPQAVHSCGCGTSFSTESPE